jgi:hypothetical protein
VRCPTGSTARSSSTVSTRPPRSLVRASQESRARHALVSPSCWALGWAAWWTCWNPTIGSTIPYREIPHVPALEVEGHAGELVIGQASGASGRRSSPAALTRTKAGATASRPCCCGRCCRSGSRRWCSPTRPAA